MGCMKCERDGGTYPYRWKDATVVLLACRAHAHEILDVLNRYQELDRSFAPQPTKEES